MDPVKTEFNPGDLIADRYEVQRILGRGGMGVVYLVLDREVNDRRALKTLLPQYVANGAAVRRFVREVTTVRRLNHPAIVRIYDAHQIGKLLFYTMDYVKGKNLHVWLREKGQLGLGSTVRILALLADALEYAHEFTIHRDLSPDNVMVLADGSVRLLDFGLAKLSDNEGAFTIVGTSLGKKQYNAPEQMANATDVDCRADIYSLGVMFFVMLAGKLPKMGESLCSLRPDLPKDCDVFLKRAMAMFPEQRYPTAHDFRIALLHLYDISTGKAPAGSLPEPVLKPRKPVEVEPEAEDEPVLAAARETGGGEDAWTNFDKDAAVPMSGDDWSNFEKQIKVKQPPPPDVRTGKIPPPPPAKPGPVSLEPGRYAKPKNRLVRAAEDLLQRLTGWWARRR
ncbi:MAG: Serine/threonine protein kinase [Candidatus Hydrogenedentes bacterium]|nr:Serine/threonine protein kinase [Candidatus Hydrogenedentota bacterium]